VLLNEFNMLADRINLHVCQSSAITLSLSEEFAVRGKFATRVDVNPLSSPGPKKALVISISFPSDYLRKLWGIGQGAPHVTRERPIRGISQAAPPPRSCSFARRRLSSLVRRFDFSARYLALRQDH
jgi:hypothetical protein